MTENASKKDPSFEVLWKYSLTWLQYENSIKECINTASYIMTNINQTADPCNDFYEYACGSWLDLNKMPANQYSYSVVTKIGDQNDKILFEALTRPGQRLDNDVYGQQKARDFFLSCQNVPILNDRGKFLRFVVHTLLKTTKKRFSK